MPTLISILTVLPPWPQQEIDTPMTACGKRQAQSVLRDIETPIPSLSADVFEA